VKKLGRKFQPRLFNVRDKSEEILTEYNSVMDRWKEYCEELYSGSSKSNRDSASSDEIRFKKMKKNHHLTGQKLSRQSIN